MQLFARCVQHAVMKNARFCTVACRYCIAAFSDGSTPMHTQPWQQQPWCPCPVTRCTRTKHAKQNFTSTCGNACAPKSTALVVHLDQPPRTQGAYKYHQYQVVGRHLPTTKEPEPPVYRMKLWATDPVSAKSKFWYFLRKLRKVKKANGQILAINEV